ncbi:adhesion G-protein coupled receptor F1-like [Arapaima gigas]
MGFFTRVYTITALCILGLLSNLDTCAGDTSNKVFYAEIEVEEGAVQNVSNLFSKLLSLNVSVDGTVVTISQFNITTACEIRGNKTICTCSEYFIWSGSVCDSHPECCNENECYVKTFEPTPICTPMQRVTISGSATLVNETYSLGLNNPTSSEYSTFVNRILTQLKQVYSTFSGFDSLKITGLRQGSVIVDFILNVNAPFPTTQLENKTVLLQQSMNATFEVTTTGMVQINAPNSTICYDSIQSMSCTINDPSLSTCSWSITTDNTVYNIVGGTEATVSAPCELSLLKTSQIWEGTYNCSFSKGFITHTASASLDIALLPEEIQILSDPQYPECLKPEGIIKVNVTCTIENSTENYNVTWIPSGSTNYSIKANDFVYNSIIVLLDCSKQADVNVTCTYINRKSQSRNASLLLPVIYPSTPVCIEDGKWPKAKDNTTAQLLCPPGTVGMKRRPCISTIWQEETSPCVKKDLNNILQDTNVLLKGRGSVGDLAVSVFERLKNTTNNTDEINTYANINASVQVLFNMHNASNAINGSVLNETILPGLVGSSSNLLDPSLISVWDEKEIKGTLPVQYLDSIEGLVSKTYINGSKNTRMASENVMFLSSTGDKNSNISVFNVTVNLSPNDGTVKTVAFKSLSQLLPGTTSSTANSIILSATLQNTSLENKIKMTFPLLNSRPTNYELFCVFWDFNTSQFSREGCSWEKSSGNTEAVCICEHLTPFSVLMSKGPIQLKFLDEITYVGLGASICSLTICILIEFLVWSAVVKSNISHFRHTALVNISLCLLIADCSFLASDFVTGHQNWCICMVIVKHFCYLAMFFWMLCLSVMLLHQLMFVFHQLRKKVYLTFSICIGYLCPLLIVLLTYISYDNGEVNLYYSPETCWLLYSGTLKGSIHAFFIPVLTIVVVNFLAMIVVITKLLRPQMSDGSKTDEKEITKSILKAVVFLTPIFGVTWILGFFVLTVDFTDGFLAAFINYAFTILNAFQGVFILLTGCFGEKKVRDAVLKYFISKPAKPSKNESSTKVVSMKK